MVKKRRTQQRAPTVAVQLASVLSVTIKLTVKSSQLLVTAKFVYSAACVFQTKKQADAVLGLF